MKNLLWLQCFGGSWNYVTEEHQPGKGRSKTKKNPPQDTIPSKDSRCSTDGVPRSASGLFKGTSARTDYLGIPGMGTYARKGYLGIPSRVRTPAQIT